MAQLQSLLAAANAATNAAEYSAAIQSLSAAYAALDDAARMSPEAAQAASIVMAYHDRVAAMQAPAPAALPKPPAVVSHGGRAYHVHQPAVLVDDQGRKAVAFRTEEEARRSFARLLCPELFQTASGPTEEEVAYIIASAEADRAMRDAAARGAIVLPEAEGRPWWHYAIVGLGVALAVGGCWYFYQQRDSQSPHPQAI
jgi:multidrug efflux pump subunit AcrA (membrane-fusion protein)